MNDIYTLSVREPTYLGPKIIKQESIGQYFLSTVRLPKRENQEDVFETCLFTDTLPSRSEIIGREPTVMEALICHERIKLTLQFVEGM